MGPFWELVSHGYPYLTLWLHLRFSYGRNIGKDSVCWLTIFESKDVVYMAIICPRCEGEDAVKNGYTRFGDQNFKCRFCGRQFVLSPKRRVSKEVRAIIDRMLDDGFQLSKIAKITGISNSWISRRKKTL